MMFTADFDAAFAHTIGIEGGYSDNPNDPGGKTKFGVTERVARKNGYIGDMREMPVEIAKEIAKREYWDSLSLDTVAGLSAPIAAELFDTGYNMGPPVAARFLQEWLNAFNRRGQDYADISSDGKIGPATTDALKQFLDKRGTAGTKVLLAALNASQAARYLGVVEARPASEDFIYGWISRRVLA